MLPEPLRTQLAREIEKSDHPRERAIDVMFAVQKQYGYLTDQGLEEAAGLLGMTALELDELATFYDFIYREPVGTYVIHVCDGLVCWMFHECCIFDYLCRKLGVGPGQTTADGLFTVVPTACIGHCDRAPAMLVNGRPYGPLTPEAVDDILEQLRRREAPLAIAR